MLNERIAARIPESLREELSRLAVANDRPLSYMVRRAIAEHVSAQDLSWDKGGDGLSSGRRPPAAGGQS
jgi:predicted transcriptional regulator